MRALFDFAVETWFYNDPVTKRTLHVGLVWIENADMRSENWIKQAIKDHVRRHSIVNITMFKRIYIMEIPTYQNYEIPNPTDDDEDLD